MTSNTNTDNCFKHFLYCILYSIIYGVYEYEFVFTNTRFICYLGNYGNWFIMWSIFAIGIIINKVKFIDTLYLIMLFSTVEDIVYFLCYWNDNKIYPFQSSHEMWYNNQFSFFRLFELGKTIPYFPYTPLFYCLTLSYITVYVIFYRYTQFIFYFTVILVTPFYVIIFYSFIIWNINENDGYILFGISMFIIYAFFIYIQLRNNFCNYRQHYDTIEYQNDQTQQT